MKFKTLIAIVIATLLQAACGGEQQASMSAGAQDAREPAIERAVTAEGAETAEGAAARQNAQAEAPQQRAPRETMRLAQADADGADAASRFESGRHYQTLSPVQPTSTGPDQVEVAEFFMYSCIHCYNFDPYLEEWKTSTPDYVSFVRVPTVWNELAQVHGRAYYTAEALGKLDEMHGDFFREIHSNGNALQSEEAMAEFFGRYDVAEEEFSQTFNSFTVHAKVQRADELMRRYRVSSTPTIVVNGKYRTDGSMAGGYDTLIELIDELAAAEHAGG